MEKDTHSKKKSQKPLKNNSFTPIYEIVKQIPKGMVTTYGQIARLIGNPRWSQVVGFALHANPDPSTIPCHRVVNRFGGLSPAFAFGGENRHRELLEEEGISFGDDGNVEMAKHMWYGPQI